MIDSLISVTFRYVDLNVRCSAQFGKYSEQVPQFLHNRPSDVVQHIMQNLIDPDSRSAKRVKQVNEGHFTVDGKISVRFGYELKYPHCDCSEWRHSRLPCKHFCLIFSCVPGWGWERLSSLYRESPLLNFDDIVLNTSVTKKQVSSDDCADTPEPHIGNEITEEDTADAVQQPTLPLPPRKKASTKALQIHCRTVMKELVNASYLIKDEKCLKKLAEDPDHLYTKAKTMMPNEDGVPLEKASSVGKLKKKGAVTPSEAAKSPSTTEPLPLQTHGAKKHPANGRYGAKAEW